MTQRTTGNAFLSPYTGGTLYTSLDTSGTAPGATTETYCTEIDLPYSKYLTGTHEADCTAVSQDILCPRSSRYEHTITIRQEVLR